MMLPATFNLLDKCTKSMPSLAKVTQTEKAEEQVTPNL